MQTIDTMRKKPVARVTLAPETESGGIGNGKGLSGELDRVTFLRLPQVKAATGLSRSSIYEKIQEGTFPQPVQIGIRAVGWIEAEIRQWAANRVLAARADICFTGGKRMAHSIRPESGTPSRKLA